MEIKIDLSKEIESLKDFIWEELRKFNNISLGKLKNKKEEKRNISSSSGLLSVGDLAKNYKLSKLSL